MNPKTKFKYIDNISLSGYKLVRLFVLLSQNSCTEADINQMYLEDELVLKKQSKDTIKSYINILRSIGCDISRPSKSNQYRYILINYTFKPYFEKELVEGLVEIKKNLSSINDWKFLISLMALYKKIDDFFLNKELLGALSFDTTTLSSLDLKIVSQLEKYCKVQRVITVLYNSPNSGDKAIAILPEHLFFENNYLYLWGQNPSNKEDFYLRVDRIKSIEVVEFNKAETKKNQFKVLYRLKGNAVLAFRENANKKTLKKTDGFIEVEADVSSEFHFIQEVLGYGLDCEILSPDSIKNQIAEKIKSVLKIYEEEPCK